TDVVTITIGGNDIGFADFGKACVLSFTSCHIGSSAHSSAVDKIDNELPARLESTYRTILSSAPNADVYVMGYPHVAPVKTGGDPIDPRCTYLYNSGYDATGI